MTSFNEFCQCVYVTSGNGILSLSLSLCRIYYWYDEKGKKTKCTAPQYVDFVMSLCQKLVTDEEIFPTKYGEFNSGSSSYRLL